MGTCSVVLIFELNCLRLDTKSVDKLSTALDSLSIQIWFLYRTFSEMFDGPNNMSLN